MPNLSKKKGRRRFNPDREVAKAQRILEKHKSEKFLNNAAKQGKSWEYGHLTPNQAMTGSDKLFHKKVIKVSKSRGLADDTDENPYYKSQYNDDRNLTNFENDQIFRHQVRAINDNSDIDPSDSELENDSDTLKDIDDNDDIFAFRRGRNKTQSEEEDEDELLESSGDDLDREDDDGLLDQQKDHTLDIDQEINEQMQIDNDSDDDDEQEQINDDIETMEESVQRKKNNKRGRRAQGVNMREIEQQIMNDDDENSKRLLSLSKQFAAKRIEETNRLYDSDGSSYYHSSDDDESFEDMERNKYKANSDDEVDNIAEEGVGKVSWGNKRADYYGAEGVNKRFKSKSDREQYRELRDEEAIGIQMQKDELKYQRQGDFMDLEMEMMMNEEMGINDGGHRRKPSKHVKNGDNDKKKKIVNEKHKEIANKFSSWFNEDNDEMLDNVETSVSEKNGNVDGQNVEDEMVNEEEENEDRVNIERIHKQIGDEQAKIIKRDHPELPGMLKELKEIVEEMKGVYVERQRAIEKRFDDAIEDSTLFVELLRTYSSTICFYLQLKAKKIDSDKMKKHGIFGTLLKLRHRVNSFRKVYKKSIDFLNNLPSDWDRKEYLKQKRELFEYEKQRQQQLHEQRMLEEREKRKQESIEKRKLRKKKKKEEELKSKLFRKGFNRLNNEDTKLEGEDMRRGITQKIFKSSGLKRYRKQGIPRVKARIKYMNKMKLYKRKGYKPFKGKLPNGRMEYNINSNITHSKRLT